VRVTVCVVRLENGLRIPSTAEEVLADTQRLSSRNTGSRKYWLVADSFLLIIK
jgi:hypothetical protein